MGGGEGQLGGAWARTELGVGAAVGGVAAGSPDALQPTSRKPATTSSDSLTTSHGRRSGALGQRPQPARSRGCLRTTQRTAGEARATDERGHRIMRVPDRRMRHRADGQGLCHASPSVGPGPGRPQVCLQPLVDDTWPRVRHRTHAGPVVDGRSQVRHRDTCGDGETDGPVDPRVDVDQAGWRAIADEELELRHTDPADGVHEQRRRSRQLPIHRHRSRPSADARTWRPYPVRDLLAAPDHRPRRIPDQYERRQRTGYVLLHDQADPYGLS